MNIKLLPSLRLIVSVLLLALLGGLSGCGSADKKEEPIQKTYHGSDLWDRVRSSFELQYAYDMPEVRERIAWFRRNQKYIDRSSQRGARYLHHILEETEQRGMPGEIALLPVVESAFQPFAYSPAHASGIWQFIPATGRRYGLRQNWWYDGRRDILESTRGALEYLQALNDRFDGDWLLAVAAYNTGEGNVEKAIRRNRKAGKPTDFWSLSLHTETRGYVPQLLALAAIVEDPERHDLTLKKIPNRPYFKKVPTHGPIQLSLAARAAGISTKEIKNLNPGFRRWARGPGGPHHLLLPGDKADAFEKNLTEFSRNERIQWHRHTVKKGETLGTIAAWFKIPLPVLQQVNGARGNTVALGQDVLVPTAPRSNYQPNTRVLAKKPKSRKSKSRRTASRKESARKARIHVVRSGENLSVIAKKRSVPLAKLIAWNGISHKAKLMPGQRLKLYSPKSTKKPKKKPRVHVVRPGENLSVIAKKHRISLEKLTAWNGISRKSLLKPGQRLKLQAPPPAKKPKKKPRIHVVRSGESLSVIAKKHRVSLAKLLAWNAISRKSILRPGQRLKLY